MVSDCGIEGGRRRLLWTFLLGILVLQYHYAMLLDTNSSLEKIITISNAQLVEELTKYNYLYYYTLNNGINGFVRRRRLPR